MSQISQEKPEGNTKTSGNGIKNQLYRWVFTLPGDEISQASQLSQHLSQFCKEFTFSLEKGETGYIHWQGCFSLKQKEYFATVKNHFPSSIHLEPCKHWFKAVNYCKKAETHLEGPYNEKSTFLKLPENLFDWQQKVITEISTDPDDRTINWYWEPKGCKGKTVLCKVLASKYNALILGNGALKDIAYAIKDAPKIVAFNLTRSNEERVNYGAIEAVKDGLIFSAKYESGTKIFNSPHVIVFSNFPPDERAMSIDRWKIIEL